MSSDPGELVRWEELLPEEFAQRLAVKPVVYLPMGLCEPHGHVAPFGLDTFKAEYLCNEAARRYGGIVAPTMGYHIHETGYHAPWLRQVVGNVNPRLAALPPHLVLETLLYQFRAFRNAGFRAAVVITGHGGGNERDLRMVAQAFAERFPIEHHVCVDPELVLGKYAGDHAGRTEVSQMMHIRPDLVRIERSDRARDPVYGRMAQHPDAVDARAELGEAILGEQLTALGAIVGAFRLDSDVSRHLDMSEMDPIWGTLYARKHDWRTLNT